MDTISKVGEKGVETVFSRNEKVRAMLPSGHDLYAESACMAGTRFSVIDAMALKSSVSTVSVCRW